MLFFKLLLLLYYYYYYCNGNIFIMLNLAHEKGNTVTLTRIILIHYQLLMSY